MRKLPQNVSGLVLLKSMFSPDMALMVRGNKVLKCERLSKKLMNIKLAYTGKMVKA